MSITEGVYECLTCHDVFKAKSGEFSKCKCGKSEVEPSYFGYSYKNHNKVKTIEQNSYYLEEEFIKLPHHIQAIYDEIKKLKQETGYKYFLMEMTERGKNQERYLSKIIVTYSERVHRYSSETNELSLDLDLKKGGYEGDEQTKARLQKFLELMKKIESGEMNFSERGKLIEFAEEENIYYNDEPTGEVNYKFHL